MKIFLQKYGIALLLSLVIGLGTFLPLWNSVHSSPNFAGIYKETAADESYYLARGRDVIDGHPFLSNPYIAEYKHGSPLQVWLPDYLLATPLAWFSIPVQDGYLAYSILFVSVLFFLVFALATKITASRKWGIGVALFLNVGLCSIWFTRTPSPQFNLIFLLLAILFFLRFLETRRRIDLCSSILSFGLLFYIYPYFWTFWAATLGIFIVSNFFFLKDRVYRPVAAILLGGFVIGIPYFLSVREAERLPYYTETLQRIGLIFTHFPSGFEVVAISILAIGIFCAAWRWHIVKFDSISLLLASGALASIVAVNQHIITGQNLEFSSHYLLACVVWCVLALAYIVAKWIQTLSSKKFARAICIILVFTALLSAVFGEYRMVRNDYTYTSGDIHRQIYAPAFSWLNAHTKKEDVVFADDDFSALVPVYTADNVYSSDYSILFFMPNQEVETRYIINHYWDAFTQDYILANQRQIFGTQYIDEYAHNRSKNILRALFGFPQVSYNQIPPDAIARVQNEAHTIQTEDFYKALHTYSVNYIVWDTTADPEWDLDRYSFLKKQFESNGIIVYSIEN